MNPASLYSMSLGRFVLFGRKSDKIENKSEVSKEGMLGG
jgi:hypothetical protein